MCVVYIYIYIYIDIYKHDRLNVKTQTFETFDLRSVNGLPVENVKRRRGAATAGVGVGVGVVAGDTANCVVVAVLAFSSRAQRTKHARNATPKRT